MFKIIKSAIRFYDHYTSKNMQATIGDLLASRGEIEPNQFITVTRLLDVEDYYGGDDSFRRQNCISNAKYSSNRDQSAPEFRSLIKSYEKNGYDVNSNIVVNSHFSLINGTHRLALNYYHGYHIVSTRIIKRAFRRKTGIESFIKLGIPLSLINEVDNKLREMHSELIKSGDSFSCITDDINSCKLLSKHCKPQRIIKYEEYKGERFPTKGYIILFSVDNPIYVIKNNRLISKRCQQIENLVRDKNDLSNIQITYSCFEGYNTFKHIEKNTTSFETIDCFEYALSY